MAETLIQRSRRQRPSDKARWNNDTGRVVREFFGLSPSDEAWVEQEVGFAVQVNLDKSEGK